jgi:hypothetical protein
VPFIYSVNSDLFGDLILADLTVISTVIITAEKGLGIGIGNVAVSLKVKG